MSKSPGEAPGVYPIVKRGKELKYLSFTVVELGGSLREHEVESWEEELSLDFYTGAVRVEVEGTAGRWSTEVGRQSSIQEAGPMVYVPASDQPLWQLAHLGNNQLKAAHPR